ncbi:YqhA family protein [Gloeocapsopsis dulcis]|uniref:YqhA family protein n=1 Tax=Gloeocapsopsis dulcis AAB1 = 1H9 TaxID=1433147 RepID=A0A6N8FSV4_9CHRO|nr:YqhA family protein [Gloeocapsopsis dulcis]MUL35405.1 hypothetical protein [Gloeocapsopsis dulcis AAB1 = 1H9]WNN90397.1 YqhA family protein [Gloeocapsopsis dulcis]
MMRRLLSSSKYIMILPALSNVMAALVLMIYSTIQTCVAVVTLLRRSFTGNLSKDVIFDAAISFLEIADIVLLATVILVIGLGLYELFISQLNLPGWLLIRNLDDLKDKLIGTVVAVISILFLGAVVNNIPNLLPFGASVALVIVALAIFTNWVPNFKKDS